MHRILIIDDLQTIHDDFQKILAAPAHEPSSLASAKAALFGSAPTRRTSRAGFDVDHALQGVVHIEPRAAGPPRRRRAEERRLGAGERRGLMSGGGQDLLEVVVDRLQVVDDQDAVHARTLMRRWAVSVAGCCLPPPGVRPGAGA